MTEPYPATVRDRARDLWLDGKMTDEAIAQACGVTRTNTVREWRREGAWEDLKRLIDAKVEFADRERSRGHVAKLNARHDQLGETIEAMILRYLRSASSGGGRGLSARDIRALALAVESAQRIRRTAADADVPSSAEATPNLAAMPAASRIVRLVIAERPESSAQPQSPSA